MGVKPRRAAGGQDHIGTPNGHKGGLIGLPSTALCEAAGSVLSFLKLCRLGVDFPTNQYGEYVRMATKEALLVSLRSRQRTPATPFSSVRSRTA